MAGDAAGNADADSGDLRVAGPDAGTPVYAVRVDAEGRQRFDQRRLQRAHVPARALPPAAQIENRVADELAGAVESDVAAAVGAMNRGAERGQPFGIEQQVLFPPAGAQRVGGRMLQQQQAGVAVATAGIDQPSLLRQRLVVRDEAEAADGAGRGCGW